MAQSLSEGSVFNYTTTTGVVNGALIVTGRRAGVALNSATGAGQVIALALEGVFNVPCAATGTMTAGEPAYYRVTGTPNKVVDLPAAAAGKKNVGMISSGTTVSGLTIVAPAVGYFWETKTATSARTHIKVKLIGGVMPIMGI